MSSQRSTSQAISEDSQDAVEQLAGGSEATMDGQRDVQEHDSQHNGLTSQRTVTPQSGTVPLQSSTRANLPSRTSQAKPLAEKTEKKPKKRLIIRKMVLVNFKSYAGRQEIGPFHKVSPQPGMNMRLRQSGAKDENMYSHSPPLLDPTDLASPIPLTPCFSCSGTGLARCDRPS